MTSYTNTKSIREWAVQERPREKFLERGKDALTDIELLAIILGSGHKDVSAIDLSRKILTHCENDLRNLSSLDVEDLIQFKGIGEAKAVLISTVFELARRRQRNKPVEKFTISNSSDAFSCFEPRLSGLKHEEFWMLLLNRAHKVIKMIKVSSGGVGGTVVDPKMVFNKSISYLASSIILCHNHPSGNLRPSKADIEITRKIQNAGKSLDIQVLDHLIIANNSYFSFSDEGLM